jgi:cytochrome oxidase assembly protein ShyY1
VPSSIILHGLSLWQLRRRARQTALHTRTDWHTDLKGSTI